MGAPACRCPAAALASGWRPQPEVALIKQSFSFCTASSAERAGLRSRAPLGPLITLLAWVMLAWPGPVIYSFNLAHLLGQLEAWLALYTARPLLGVL